MYDTTFFARKSKVNPRTEEEVFLHIEHDINLVKMYGSGPYYKIVLRESDGSESPKYFGWKDLKRCEYTMIFPFEGLVRMCFPYGVEAEEKEGRGRLVGFILEKYIDVTDENV